MALPEGDEKLGFETPSVNLLRQHMTEAMKLRVLDIPEPPTSTDTPTPVDVRVAILFSGGLDCSVLARMADQLLPSSQGIDLINVAFQNPRVAAQHKGSNGADDSYEKCPDRQTGRKAFAELKTACPSRLWRFIAVSNPLQLVAHSDTSNWCPTGQRAVRRSYGSQGSSCISNLPPRHRDGSVHCPGSLLRRAGCRPLLYNVARV